MPEARRAAEAPEPAAAPHRAEVDALKAHLTTLTTALELAVDRSRELEAEAGRLRAILAAVPAWVSYLDHEKRYLYNNWAIGDGVGDSAEDVTGRLAGEVLDDEVYRAMRPDLELALAGKPVTRVRSLRSVAGDRTLAFRTVYTPCFAADSSVEGVVIVIGEAPADEQRERSHEPVDGTPFEVPRGPAPTGALP